MEKPGRRELNKIQCRERILKTSRRLFTTKGYENTTIGDVAEASWISKATLYNYFPSKENLLRGIADAALEEVRQLIAVEMRDEPSGLVKIRRVLETLALDAVRYVQLSRRTLYLNSSPESGLYPTREELVEILAGLVREARDKGELRRDLPEQQMTEAFLGVYLLTQFGWENISSYSEDECVARVNGAIDCVLGGMIRREET